MSKARSACPQPSFLAPEAQSLYARDRSSLAAISKHRQLPLAIVEGHGSWLTEAGGRQLLDLNANWTACALGHGHPAVAAAIAAAAQYPPGAGAGAAAHPNAVALAEDLLALLPTILDGRVYLGHAGTDANDVAIRACRNATGRRRVLAFERSYHGGMGSARGVSGLLATPTGTTNPDVSLIPYPDPLRPQFADPDMEVPETLAAAQQVLREGDTACMIVEPLLSDGGLVVPPPGFLKSLHELCVRYEVPLICDEVKVGLARTGLLHAFEHDQAAPDIVTFGKALGGGLPLSAAVGPAHILNAPAAAALLTTAGNPICSAAGRAVLNTLHSEKLAARAATSGTRFATGLRSIAAGNGPGGDEVADRIGDVRGRGLAIAVDLVQERSSLERDPALAEAVAYRAWELGAVVHHVGGNVLEITPPLTISDAEIDSALDILGRAIGDAVRAGPRRP